MQPLATASGAARGDHYRKICLGCGTVNQCRCSTSSKVTHSVDRCHNCDGSGRKDYNPNEARVPAGSSEGGEFASHADGMAATAGHQTAHPDPVAITPEQMHAQQLAPVLNEADTERAAAIWADMGFRQSPDEMVTQVMAGSGLTAVGHMELIDDDDDPHKNLQLLLTLKQDGKDVGTMARFFNPVTHTVDHELFELPKNLQGGGIAKAVLRNSLEAWQAAGIHKVNVHANIDVGGYAWAKYGFVPRDDDWASAAMDVRARANELLAAGAITADHHKAVMALVSSPDPKEMWRISDLTMPVSVEGNKTTLGKALLLNQSWYGTLDTRNKPSMDRFTEYVSRKPTEKAEKALEVALARMRKALHGLKFNPNHDDTGRFAAADGGGGGHEALAPQAPTAAGPYVPTAADFPPSAADHYARPADYQTSGWQMPDFEHRTPEKPRMQFSGNTDKAIKDWTALGLQVSPQGLVDAMVAGTGLTCKEGFTSYEYNDDGRLTLNVRTELYDGDKNVGTMERDFSPQQQSVDHTLLKLNAAHQGHTGKAILRNSMAEYQKSHIKEITLHANIDVGGYAWARYGFVPSFDSWDHMASNLREIMTDSAPDADGNIQVQRGLTMPRGKERENARVTWRAKISPTQAAALKTIADNPTKTTYAQSNRDAWTMADLTDSIEVGEYNPDTGKRFAVQEYGGHMPLGKFLLLGSDWHGKLDFADKEAMDRFNHYTQEAPAKKSRSDKAYQEQLHPRGEHGHWATQETGADHGSGTEADRPPAMLLTSGDIEHDANAPSMDFRTAVPDAVTTVSDKLIEHGVQGGLNIPLSPNYLPAMTSTEPAIIYHGYGVNPEHGALFAKAMAAAGLTGKPEVMWRASTVEWQPPNPKKPEDDWEVPDGMKLENDGKIARNVEYGLRYKLKDETQAAAAVDQIQKHFTKGEPGAKDGSWWVPDVRITGLQTVRGTRPVEVYVAKDASHLTLSKKPVPGYQHQGRILVNDGLGKFIRGNPKDMT